jgi:hypothetical protein
VRPADIRRATLAAGLAALLGGCAEWVERREQITPWSGDAVAANRAMQVIDPWPRGSGDTRLRTDGERGRLGIERYREGKIASPQGLGQSTSGAPPGQGAGASR